LRFLPPLNISRKEIDSLIPVLTDSIAKLSAK
jgi:4-aminobutyrate aminotransferase-like enzyme